MRLRIDLPELQICQGSQLGSCCSGFLTPARWLSPFVVSLSPHWAPQAGVEHQSSWYCLSACGQQVRRSSGLAQVALGVVLSQCVALSRRTTPVSCVVMRGECTRPSPGLRRSGIQARCIELKWGAGPSRCSLVQLEVLLSSCSCDRAVYIIVGIVSW